MNFDYKLLPGRELKKYGELEKNIEPQITIVTPFYNTKEEILRETANSILSQTYPYFEWIIVDDGSKDENSLKGLNNIAKLDDRIKVFHKQNEGLAQTRDYGAKKSSDSAKYLLFIDDDDQISATYMECAYWTLETNKGATWAYTDSIGFGAQEYVWRKWYNPIREKKENRLIATSLIRKKDFFEAGGYEIKAKGVYEDWNFWLKLIGMEKYPVRINSLSFWYRRKDPANSELGKARANHEKAMEYINETASKIRNTKKAIQYPKQDYDWDALEDRVDSIEVPIYKKNNKIKVLMIVPWMVTGGGDKFNLDLIRGCDKNKYEFIIVSTLPSDNEWKQKFEEYSIVYDLTSFLDRKYWTSFLNYLITKNNVDIIFNASSQWGYNALPYLKSKHPEIPIMDYVHMEEWYWRKGGYLRDSAIFESVIDKTLVCNKASEKLLVEHFGKHQKDVQTVYIGVDEKKFDPANYSKTDILKKLNIENEAKNKYIIGFICRITAQKRPFLLLEIVKALKEKRDDFTVVVAGDGDLLENIKHKRSSMKLSENIVFLGNCSNAQEIYAISDLTLNCSIKEGLALTSYESLAMGVPVISSDVGGQKELINNEVGRTIKCYQDETEIYNYEYKKEEIEQYVVAIEEVLSDLNKYKQNCRNRILNGFTINNMIDNMEGIFNTITEKQNVEKIENGKNLAKCQGLTKELITSYMIGTKNEYEWQADEFNRKNVDRDYEFEKEQNKYAYYEQTLEYKIKYPIVVILKKIRIYDFLKRLLGKK